MSRELSMLIFASVAVLVLGSVHYYLYYRLAVAPALPSVWRRAVKWAFVSFVVMFPLSFVVARAVDNSVSRYLVTPLYVWLGLMLLFFFAFLAYDVVRGLLDGGSRLTGNGPLVSDPGRRRFLARAVAGVVSGVVLSAGALAVPRALGKLRIRKVEVPLPGLPEELDGYTIAHLSDLHLGPMRSGEWMREVVDRTNELKPDMVAITGDLVDGTVEQLADDAAPLADLVSRDGTFFVTGNHEYISGAQPWIDHLPSLGMRVLENEHVVVRGDAGGGFTLAGVHDHDASRFEPGQGPDVVQALAGRDDTRPVVLLAHQPRVAEDAHQNGVGLVLSGHTHGGQIWPFSYLVTLQQPYLRGLNDHKGTQVFVSEGTGFWGPPMRLGTQSEICLLTLRAPSAGAKRTESGRDAA